MSSGLLATPSALISRHLLSGCSTGYNEVLRGQWPELVSAAVEMSALAAELSALHERELRGLIDYLSSRPTLPFEYVSAHSPTKGRHLVESDLVDCLCKVARHVTGVVVHPDLMHDVHAYEPLGRKLIVENMDARKLAGRDADELSSVFGSLPRAGLCLDIAHAKDVDCTMEVAHRLLDVHGTRLRQVHISSLDQRGHHVSLTAADEELFAPILDRCRDVPWILEAQPRDC